MQKAKDKVIEYSFKPIRRFTYKEVTSYGTCPPPELVLTACRKIASEITVRLSNRCKEINKLPFGLGQNPYAIQVKNWYTQSCMELWDYLENVNERRFDKLGLWDRYIKKMEYCDAADILEEMAFDQPTRNTSLISKAPLLIHQLKSILQIQVARHKPIVLFTAQAVHQLAKIQPTLTKENPMVQKFLKRFHQSRISTRLLISHCVALSEPLRIKDTIGVFSTNLDVDLLCQMAIDHAATIFIDEYGTCPEIIIQGSPILPTFCIPAFLEYALFELLKNAIKATIDRNTNLDTLEPVLIKYYSDRGMTFIEIHDKGGGIERRSDMFRFHYSTAPPPVTDMVIAGYGYGLPLSKLYSRYLGGDLHLVACPGGTIARIMLKTNFSDTDPVL